MQIHAKVPTNISSLDTRVMLELKFWGSRLNVWRHLRICHTSSDKLRCQVLSLGNRHLSIDSDGTHSSQTVRIQNPPQGQMFQERRNVCAWQTSGAALVQNGEPRPLLAACLLSSQFLFAINVNHL